MAEPITLEDALKVITQDRRADPTEFQATSFADEPAQGIHSSIPSPNAWIAARNVQKAAKNNPLVEFTIGGTADAIENRARGGASRGILQDFFAWWAEHPYLGTIAVVALVLIFGDVVRRRRARR